MKVILIWTAILGMMVVPIVGCGNSDSSVKEEMPNREVTSQPLTEPPDPHIAPILGTWHFQTAILFENGVQKQRTNLGSFLFILTFKPDKTFEAKHRYPIEEFADLDFLKSKGLEDIRRIVITFWGKYEIDEKQVWLDVDRTTVEPKEAPEIDSDFENPIFFYVDETGRADYSLSDDDNRLELVLKADILRAELIHHRIRPL